MGLDRRRLLVYGLAHGGKSTFWYVGEWLFLYVLTEMWHIPPAEAAWTLGLGMVVSGLLDLVVARAFSSRGLRAATAADLQVVGAIACAIAIVGLGASSGAAASQGVMAGAAILFFRVAYAFIDVPQNTLLPLLAGDERERVALTAARYVASGAAALVVAGVGAQALRSVSSQGSGKMEEFAIAIAAVAVGSAVLLRYDIRSSDPESVPTQSVPRSDQGEDLPFKAIALTMFLVSTSTAVFGRLQLYLAAYGHSCARLPLAVTVGMIVAQPVWVALSRSHSVRRVMKASGWLTLGAAFELTAAIEGGYGHGAALLAGGCFGFASVGLTSGLWSLAASAATTSVPKRQPVMTIALFTCSSKVGLACGCLVAGWALEGAIYRSGEISTLLNALVWGGAVCAIASWMLTRQLA